MSRKIFSAIFAILMIVGLSACSDKKEVINTDMGSFEDYYSELAYEVTNEDGIVTEQMYFLDTDAEHTNTVGRKDVYYDPETGKMVKYTVSIGVGKISRIVNYAIGGNGDNYSEMFFDDDENLTSGKWDNNYTDTDGAKVREVGHQEYYTNGKISTYYGEVYRDGVLSEKVTREYNEDGVLTSETME